MNPDATLSRRKDPPDFDVLEVAPPDEVYIQANPGDEFPQAL